MVELFFISLLELVLMSIFTYFLFLNQIVCYVYSKEPSQWDGSFGHSKHMLKLMDKKKCFLCYFLLNDFKIVMFGKYQK